MHSRSRRTIYQCPHCDYVFIDEESVEQHKQEWHRLGRAPDQIPEPLPAYLLNVTQKVAVVWSSLTLKLRSSLSNKLGRDMAEVIADCQATLPTLTPEQRLAVLEEMWNRFGQELPQATSSWLRGQLQSSAEARDYQEKPQRRLRLMFPDHAEEVHRVSPGIRHIQQTLDEVCPIARTASKLRPDFDQFLRVKAFLESPGHPSVAEDVVGYWLRERQDTLGENLQEFLGIARTRNRQQLLAHRENLVRRALGLLPAPPPGSWDSYNTPILLMSFLRFLVRHPLKARREIDRLAPKIAMLLMNEEIDNPFWKAMIEDDCHWDLKWLFDNPD